MNVQKGRRVYWFACVLVVAMMVPADLHAAGGTSIVANPGQKAFLNESWPEGVGELVNDPARTTGWNSWFTEWPNDVNQYAFEIKTSEDLNRLIRNLAAVKSKLRQIRLSYLKEPQSLGWVTSVPKGNGIPVIFSIGDQSRIDQWYKHVRKPFGKMEFLAAPVAVPPTLTIFVQNEVVNLDQLKIPPGIELSLGYVPTVFHRSNTTIEKKQEKEAAQKAKTLAVEAEVANLDATSKQAFDSIRAFVEKHSELNREPIQK